MMKATRACLIGLFIVSTQLTAATLELATNGDFELDLDAGWVQVLEGDGALIERATHHDQDPDNEVLVWKPEGAGQATLSQRVTIPTTDLMFSATLRTNAIGELEAAWDFGGLIITYLDQYDTPLGRTVIGSLSRYCPWKNSTTDHIIETTPVVWELHEFNFNEELYYLSGVDPTAIRTLDIRATAIVMDC